MDSTRHTDRRLLLLDIKDSCLIAAERREIEGEYVTLAKTIELGHKVARFELAPDDKVLRYGVVIDHVTEAVGHGEHLHTHILESDYLPTYTHDAGHAFVHH